MMKTTVSQQPRLISFWCHSCGEQVIEDHPIGWNLEHCATCSQAAEPRHEHLYAAVVRQAFDDIAHTHEGGTSTDARPWLTLAGVVAGEAKEQPAHVAQVLA
jgi:hypothetical protein